MCIRDRIYAALRVLELIQDRYTLDNFLDSLPKTFSTQEIKIECSDDKKFMIIKELARTLDSEKVKVNKVDGLRVQKDDGWWLLRASNTQEALIARMESNNKEDLELMKIEVDNLLRKYDLSLNK